MFFSRTTEVFITTKKLGTKYPCVKGTQVFTNNGPFNSLKGDNDFLTLTHRYSTLIVLSKRVNLLKQLVSQVSNEAHGPLVLFTRL